MLTPTVFFGELGCLDTVCHSKSEFSAFSQICFYFPNIPRVSRNSKFISKLKRYQPKVEVSIRYPSAYSWKVWNRNPIFSCKCLKYSKSGFLYSFTHTAVLSTRESDSGPFSMDPDS